MFQAFSGNQDSIEWSNYHQYTLYSIELLGVSPSPCVLVMPVTCATYLRSLRPQHHRRRLTCARQPPLHYTTLPPFGLPASSSSPSIPSQKVFYECLEDSSPPPYPQLSSSPAIEWLESNRPVQRPTQQKDARIAGSVAGSWAIFGRSSPLIQ